MNEKMGRSRAHAKVLSKTARVFLIIGIIILLITCIKGYNIIKEKERELNELSESSIHLEEMIKNEDDKKGELSKAKGQNVSDEDYESIAREEYGLIKKDEIVIKPR